jgi:hypothetical protein
MPKLTQRTAIHNFNHVMNRLIKKAMEAESVYDHNERRNLFKKLALTELKQYNGYLIPINTIDAERIAFEVHFKTDEGLTFFLLKWS